MKKILFLSFLTIVLTTNVFGQEESSEKKPFILPGKGHINVEKLNRSIDFNMDISQLSVSELRVLRNAFAARQGYIFMSSDLRGIFETTTWYNELKHQTTVEVFQ